MPPENAWVTPTQQLNKTSRSFISSPVGDQLEKDLLGKCCTVGYGQIIFHQFWVTLLCSFDSLYLRCEKVHLLASPEEGAKSLKETGSAKHFNKCQYTVLFLQMSVS